MITQRADALIRRALGLVENDDEPWDSPHPAPTFWHITRKPKFKIDPKKGGFLAFGSNPKPTTHLFVADHKTLYGWANHPYSGDRKYAAEIDVSNVKDASKWAGETQMPDQWEIRDAHNARVLRVLPINDALKAADETSKKHSDWLGRNTEVYRPHPSSGLALRWKRNGKPYNYREIKRAHGPDTPSWYHGEED